MTRERPMTTSTFFHLLRAPSDAKGDAVIAPKGHGTVRGCGE